MNFIPLEKIEPGMVLAEDIYVFYSLHAALLRKGTTLTRHLVDRLRTFDIPGIFTRADEDELPRENPLISDELKKRAVGSVKNVFDSILRNGEAQPVEIADLDHVVAHLVDNILNDQKVLVNIADLKSYDDYTYHHSLSVCLLSIGTGLAMNMNRDRLRALGLCSILHDIGKVRVPIELINKPSRLTDEEFGVIKRHSQLGGNYILEHHLGDDKLYRSIVSHHERVDGTGYPNGLKGAQIPLEAKIISVADVYDALTSNRPYRKPMHYADAVEYIMGGVDTYFDLDIVKLFLQKLEIYPVGSFVQLSTGQIGVVLNNENLLRPVVRLSTGAQEILDLYRDPKLRSVVIARSYTASDATPPSL